MGTVEIINDELNTTTVLDLLASGDLAGKTFSIKPTDPAEMARKIALRDLNATSVDDLLGGGGDVTGLRNYLNKPFLLENVEWQVSDIDGDGLPFYAVLHVVTLEGETKVLTTGAVSVVRKVAVMDARGWFPQWVKGIKADKTAAGYEPIDLVKAAANEVPFAG